MITLRGNRSPGSVRGAQQGLSASEPSTLNQSLVHSHVFPVMSGEELFLLLDGVLVAEADGEELGEFGPGSILGERALLEEGTRQATLRALTRCRLAVVPPSLIEHRFRRALAANPRRRVR